MIHSVGDGHNVLILFFKFCLDQTFLFLNYLLLDIDNIPLYSGKLLIKMKFITGKLNVYILFQSFNLKSDSSYHFREWDVKAVESGFSIVPQWFCL